MPHGHYAARRSLTCPRVVSQEQQPAGLKSQLGWDKPVLRYRAGHILGSGPRRS